MIYLVKKKNVPYKKVLIIFFSWYYLSKVMQDHKHMLNVFVYSVYICKECRMSGWLKEFESVKQVTEYERDEQLLLYMEIQVLYNTVS